MDLRAVVFVPALAGSVIFGFVFLLFAANYYLTILESTGVGAKHITWMSESIADNAWKLAYMAWLVGLWLGPAYFIGRAATAGMDSGWVKLAVPLLVIWLCFPISQLSSLSASTIWLPLVPDVFARLAQKPLVYLGFLLLSLPLLTMFAVGFKWSFLTNYEWPLLFAGLPLLVLSGFLYARLIGRLAFALRFTKSLFTEKTTPSNSATSSPIPSEEKSAPHFKQPSVLPPLNTPDDSELSGYDVKFEEPAQRPKKRIKAEVVEVEDESPVDSEPPLRLEPEPEDFPQPPRRRMPSGGLEPSRLWSAEDDEENVSYGVHEPEATLPEETKKDLVKPSEEEMRLLRRTDLPRRPRQFWTGELVAFLGQAETISAFVVATGLGGLAGAMVRLARAFNPVAGVE